MTKPRCNFEHLPNGKFRATFLNLSTGKYESNLQEPELSESMVKRRIDIVMKSWDLKYGDGNG